MAFREDDQEDVEDDEQLKINGAKPTEDDNLFRDVVKVACEREHFPNIWPKVRVPEPDHVADEIAGAEYCPHNYDRQKADVSWPNF